MMRGGTVKGPVGVRIGLQPLEPGATIGPLLDTTRGGPAVNSTHFSFDLHHTDAGCAARRSTFHTPHGAVEMPADRKPCVPDLRQLE